MFAFEKKGITAYFSSEPDNGIYDAMNKGLIKAHGDWVLFLNAGDCMYSRSVLKCVAQYSNHSYDIIYGDTVLKRWDYYMKISAKAIEVLPKEMPFCHQSVFVRSTLAKRLPFDLSYKICADMDFFTRCYVEEKRFAYVPIVISLFDYGGTSMKNQISSTKERIRLAKRYGFYEGNMVLESNLALLVITLKSMVKKVLPKSILKKIQVKELLKKGWERRG